MSWLAVILLLVVLAALPPLFRRPGKPDTRKPERRGDPRFSHEAVDRKP